MKNETAVLDSWQRFGGMSGGEADTTTHTGKMIVTVFAGIAEFERDLIRERTGVDGKQQTTWRAFRPATQAQY